MYAAGAPRPGGMAVPPVAESGGAEGGPPAGIGPYPGMPCIEPGGGMMFAGVGIMPGGGIVGPMGGIAYGLGMPPGGGIIAPCGGMGDIGDMGDMGGM